MYFIIQGITAQMKLGQNAEFVKKILLPMLFMFAAIQFVGHAQMQWMCVQHAEEKSTVL